MNNNNLNLYYIFYEVANSKNISKAAKNLYISQPAISKAISKLENSLECTLFTRNSRGVVLTAEGELLYEKIKTAFEAIEDGEEKIRQSGELGIGHISIGVSTTMCKCILLPYLKEYVKLNPHVKVSISCQSSYETIEALEQGKIDIGLVGFPSGKNTLAYKPLLTVHDTFVTTQKYLDNFSIREKLTMSNLIQSATFMMLNKENMSRKYVNSFLSSEGIELQNLIEISNMDLLIDFAKIDIGISCVIKEFVMEEIEKKELKEIKLLSKMPGREIGLAYLPSKAALNPSAMAFLDYCTRS